MFATLEATQRVSCAGLTRASMRWCGWRRSYVGPPLLKQDHGLPGHGASRRPGNDRGKDSRVRNDGSGGRLKPATQSSVGVLGPEQRDRGPHQDVEIEQHRPVLDVVEVVLDAALHLLGTGEVAAPAV